MHEISVRTGTYILPDLSVRLCKKWNLLACM